METAPRGSFRGSEGASVSNGNGRRPGLAARGQQPRQFQVRWHQLGALNQDRTGEVAHEPAGNR